MSGTYEHSKKKYVQKISFSYFRILFLFFICDDNFQNFNHTNDYFSKITFVKGKFIGKDSGLDGVSGIRKGADLAEILRIVYFNLLVFIDEGMEAQNGDLHRKLRRESRFPH